MKKKSVVVVYKRSLLFVLLILLLLLVLCLLLLLLLLLFCSGEFLDVSNDTLRRFFCVHVLTKVIHEIAVRVHEKHDNGMINEIVLRSGRVKKQTNNMPPCASHLLVSFWGAIVHTISFGGSLDLCFSAAEPDQSRMILCKCVSEKHVQGGETLYLRNEKCIA